MNLINGRLLNLINVDLPRRVIVMNICIATIAALGLTTLAGGEGQAAVAAVPVLTALFTVGLVQWTQHAELQTRPGAGGVTTDPLTGLAVASVGEEALAREFAAAQRGRPLTVVLVRIEGLKRYRVRHGKTVANQLLRVAGRTLSQHRRGMHLTAMHGAEDGTFLSILSASDREGAAIYAARLRRDLMRIEGLPGHDGVSIGVASFDLSMASPKELVRKAARAVEQGAATGGRVVVVGDDA